MSFGDGIALMDKNWFQRYWHRNKNNIRDVDWKSIHDPNRKNLLIMGDSYVAGHGIKDIEDRFGNILRDELSECYNVFISAFNGVSTVDIYHEIQQIPFTPDIILISHIPNDIEDVLSQDQMSKYMKRQPVDFAQLNIPNGMRLPRIKKIKKVGFLRENSFLMNYTTYLLNNINARNFEKKIAKIRAANPTYETTYYHHQIDTLFDLHTQVLDLIIQLYEGQKTDIAFLLFPDISSEFHQSVSDKVISQPVADFLHSRGTHSLNMKSVFDEIETQSYFVNRFDKHPNVEANHLFAELILDFLEGNYLIEKNCLGN